MADSIRKRRTLLAIGLLLLLIGIGWLCWPDGRMARARELQQQLTGPKAKQLTGDERRQKWQELRETTKALSPAQRQALQAEAGKRRMAELARYFALSAEEKTKHLDDQIGRMERFRQGMQARSGGAGGGGTGEGGTSRGKAGPGGAPGTSQPGARDRSPQARDQRRQSWLDSSTPTARAMFTQYTRELNARRTQLGLPAMSRGPGPRR